MAAGAFLFIVRPLDFQIGYETGFNSLEAAEIEIVVDFNAALLCLCLLRRSQVRFLADLHLLPPVPRPALVLPLQEFRPAFRPDPLQVFPSPSRLNNGGRTTKKPASKLAKALLQVKNLKAALRREKAKNEVAQEKEGPV